MFRAIGLIMLLIAIRFLMPAVFDGLEDTLVQVFEAMQSLLAQSHNLQASPSYTLGY